MPQRYLEFAYGSTLFFLYIYVSLAPYRVGNGMSSPAQKENGIALERCVRNGQVTPELRNQVERRVGFALGRGDRGSG